MKKIIFFFFIFNLSLFAFENKVLSGSVAFSFGNGEEHVILFSDPECPFCRKLSKQMKDKKLSKYKFDVILYPLERIHPNSKKMICYILSGEDNMERYHRYKEITTGDDISYKDFNCSLNMEKYIDSSKAMLKKYKIKRFPTMKIFMEDEFFDIEIEEL